MKLGCESLLPFASPSTVVSIDGSFTAPLSHLIRSSNVPASHLQVPTESNPDRLLKKERAAMESKSKLY